MRQLGVVILLIILGLSTPKALAVSSNPAAQQQPEGRASYDPMAHGKRTGQPKRIVETTLAGVNPKDTDYGAVVAEWRKEIFENTLHEIYFWGVIGITMLLGISVMGTGWLLRERERRLTISADIVTQLYNAYVMSRAKALKAISWHNQLVERYNQLDQEAADLRTRIANTTAAEPTVDTPGEVTYDVAKQERVSLSPAQPESKVVDIAADSGETIAPELAALRAKLAETELQLQRQKAQLQAKENTITNLRSRLSKAHDAFQAGNRA